MKLNYDNLDDAKTKLVGTYCMLRGKAVTIKLLNQLPGSEEPRYFVQGSYMFNGRSMECFIDDPEFNCSEYNLGYINLMRASAWFYRIPAKQWKQGLRPDQVRMRYSQRTFSDIDFQNGKALCAMMENSYPKFENATELLKSGDANIVAFHKNFAVTLDRVHSDFILEYKGTNIGYTNNLKDMKLMVGCEHLIESLKEAVYAQ